MGRIGNVSFAVNPKHGWVTLNTSLPFRTTVSSFDWLVPNAVNFDTPLPALVCHVFSQ
jgi:hypothetical protein